jgi:hypothetical protein
MTELDLLPPDQRAVLSLVLDRGKSYGEVAEMLAIPERVVRERAHAALDALANVPSSAAGGALARAQGAASGAARPDAARSGGASSAARSDAARPGGAGSGAAQSGGAGASLAQPATRSARAPLKAPSSRTGGALLLGTIVAVIVVVVVLVSSGGGGKSSTGSTSTSSATSTTSSSASKAKLNSTITLTPLDPSLKTSGTAYVLSQGSRRAFYISAQGLPPSSGFFYAVWLYNSPSSSTPLGRAPSVGSDGRMLGGNPLPTNANLYHQLIVTRERSTHPTHPGEIVLRGAFTLH